MTAKDKAEKLVSDFYAINCKLIKVKTGYDMGDRYNLVMPTAKQCALIAVEEMIYYLPSVDIYPYFAQKLSPRVKEYWQEVKQEIEKL